MKKKFLFFAVFTVIFLMFSCGGDSSLKIIQNNNGGGSSDSCRTIDGNTWSSLASRKMDWYDAKDYCESLNECGYSDWYLPDLNKLRTLIKNCPGAETGGACRLEAPHNLSDNYLDDDCYCSWRTGGYYSKLGDDENIYLWSSSTQPDYQKAAWFIPFGGVCDNSDCERVFDFDEEKVEEMYGGLKETKKFVRCVRGGSQNYDDSYYEDSDGSCSDEGELKCDGDFVLICRDESWELYEECEYGCRYTDVAECKPGIPSGDDDEDFPYCGNNVVDYDEACDGGAVECNTLNSNLAGFAECKYDCSGYDISTCEGKNNGGGNGGGATNTNCGATHNCMASCADGNCQQQCYNNASDTGRAQLDAMLDCFDAACGSVSDAEFSNCANQNCASEIQGCEGLM